MTNGQKKLTDELRRAGWRDVTPMPPTRPGGIGAAGYSPDGAWHFHVDAERNGTPNQYRIGGGTDRPARSFHARGAVPTPEQAAGAWEDAAAAEASEQPRDGRRS